MSILIKGMELPKSCWFCPLLVWNDVDYICPFNDEVALKEGIYSDCPLVEVPPIEADIKCEDCMTIIALKAALEPVTRCRDCRFYTEEDRWCRRLGLCGAFDPNDYCSHAEEGAEG